MPLWRSWLLIRTTKNPHQGLLHEGLMGGNAHYPQFACPRSLGRARQFCVLQKNGIGFGTPISCWRVHSAPLRPTRQNQADTSNLGQVCRLKQPDGPVRGKPCLSAHISRNRWQDPAIYPIRSRPDRRLLAHQCRDFHPKAGAHGRTQRNLLDVRALSP